MQAERRPATPEERALVEWLLTRATVGPEYQPFLTQIAMLRVVAKCGCGCPSVDFQPHGQASGATIVAHAFGVAPEGTAVGVLLWARASHLSGLEVYGREATQSFTLPRPGDLRPASGGSPAAPGPAS